MSAINVLGHLFSGSGANTEEDPYIFNVNITGGGAYYSEGDVDVSPSGVAVMAIYNSTPPSPGNDGEMVPIQCDQFGYLKVNTGHYNAPPTIANVPVGTSQVTLLAASPTITNLLVQNQGAAVVHIHPGNGTASTSAGASYKLAAGAEREWKIPPNTQVNAISAAGTCQCYVETTY